jgi:hypothetical protein
MLAISACGCQSSADRDQADQELRLTKLIDQRRYSEVIRLIEGDTAGSAAFQALLGMAYLGRAGFEPVRFGAQVLSAQAGTDAKLDRLIDSCDSGAIQTPGQLGFRCVLKRIWAHLPDPDGADFAKSRMVFLAAYPQPESTAPAYNTLIGTVEAVAALSRLEKLIVHYQGLDPSKISDDDINFLFKQVQLTSVDALQTLQRARHSVRKISEMITGMDQQPLFSGLDINVQWLESTGLPEVITFTTGISDESRAVEFKDELLQVLDMIVAVVKTQS